MKYGGSTENELHRRSLPSRECGLKFERGVVLRVGKSVTPFAGVWIEIGWRRQCRSVSGVTPFAGVWIEICGQILNFQGLTVTPFAGVWIEISKSVSELEEGYGHSLRGSVD